MHTLILALVMSCAAITVASDFRFGAASSDVTPAYPIRLSGYVARKTESEGVRLPIYTKALALSRDGRTALILTLDNVGISREFRDEVVARIEKEHHIPAQQIVIFSSHTHSAPCLKDAIPNIFAEDLPTSQQAAIERYTRETIDHMIEAAAAALKKMEPARLYFAQGKAGFAKNRRTQGGPVDHDLPVLMVRRADGSLGALLANYACHCTTLQGNQNFIHGDWAGIAQQEIQKRNPGAIALISIGCGADSNPNPRGELEHAQHYGEQIASEVDRLAAAQSTELKEPLAFRAQAFELPFSALPSRDEWEKRAQSPGIVGYHARKNLARLDRGEKIPASLPYLVQTWSFGSQLAMVFLPGEVVVDYALALKREFDAARLWVSGYANWVPCYIPSARILREGGYEAEDSLWYYDRPARLSDQTESLILSAAKDLVPKSFR